MTHRILGVVAISTLLALTIISCTDDATLTMDSGAPDASRQQDAETPAPDGGRHHDKDASVVADAGEIADAAQRDASPDVDASSDADAAAPLGGLVLTTTPAKQKFDLFAQAGHRVWAEVNDDQLVLMNARSQGGCIGCGGGDGDIYSPGSGASFADHIIVQNAADKSIADYGKVEVKLVGESTFRQWDHSHIPNLHLDADEFHAKLRIGGFEHIRFNNSQVGSIFREGLAHRIYSELGYAGLRSTFAFLGSNVWGNDIWVPMTLIEVYKTKFCKENKAWLKGTCDNMWEFAGDPTGGQLPSNACQVHECDNTRLTQLHNAYQLAPRGPGFEKVMAPFIDWPLFHQFQCISWILSTGDDSIHNSNNNLIIERKEDHKLIWAPYSVDISAGQDWYANTPLTGTSSLAAGCQLDPQCWQETLDSCSDLIDKFDKLNPEKLVDAEVDTLSKLNMLRDGDELRAQQLRAWYVQRQQDLPSQLEHYRVLPDLFGSCPDGLQQCADQTCNLPEDCQGNSQCSFGQTWCEQLQQCIDPNYQSCPSCMDKSMTYFCPPAGQCVADSTACDDACVDLVGPGYVFCQQVNGCTLSEQCSLKDEDGGGVGGFGGMGGIGDFGFGGFGGGPK